jgi:calcium/calmodulin-dependent serine protein kinase
MAKIVDLGLEQFVNTGKSWGSLAFQAPEVKSKHEYTEAADIWSLGVILFILLTGRLPRYDSNDDLVLCHNSERARDLVKRMLIEDPAERITLSDVIHHPWFNDSLSVIDTPCIVSGFRLINSKRRFRKAIHGAVAANRFVMALREARSSVQAPKRNNIYRLLYIYVMHVIRLNEDHIDTILLHLKNKKLRIT